MQPRTIAALFPQLVKFILRLIDLAIQAVK